MQHHEIPTITAKEAVWMSWSHNNAEVIDAVKTLFHEMENVAHPAPQDAYLRYISDLAALWNAGRVQGIREERTQQRKKKGGSK